MAFFSRPRHQMHHLAGSTRPRRELDAELEALGRYLGDEERELAGRMAELIGLKDDLDYHHALQGALKLWLFVHVPLTSALMLLILAHAVLAYAFAAGVS